MDTKNIIKNIFLPRKNTDFKDISFSHNTKTVFITATDGVTLCATVVEASAPKRIIIATHSHRSDPFTDFGAIAEFLHSTDSTVIYTHLRAHGRSDGEIATLGIKERKDCLCWINYAEKNISDDIPIYLYGKETGAMASLMTDATKFSTRIHGIIADTPFESPDKLFLDLTGNKKNLLIRTDKHLMKKYGFSLFDYSVSEAFKSLSRPVLFLYSDRSRSHITKNLFDSFQGDKIEFFYREITALRFALERFFEDNDDKTFSAEINLHYPEKTMFQLVKEASERLPDDTAYNFEGKKTSYSDMIDKIEAVAKAFVNLGIKRNDVVTLCLPNIPQTVDSLYALNRIGAVTSFIHPLSAVGEISYYLNLSESKAIVVPDLFYENVMSALKNVNHSVKVIVARIQDELPPLLQAAYILKKGKDYLNFPDKRGGIIWKDFIENGKITANLPPVVFDRNKTAVILYSGGTTGVSKGICLTDMNLNALAIQARISIESEFSRGLKNLSAMPVFHGFGLGIGIHTVLINNACCILLAQFNTKIYAAAMKKYKPNFIAGVPTIFKMLTECDEMQNEDLSYLKGMFVGGDSMPTELKLKVDTFLKNHGADIQVREGYGLTECVTASCLTPKSTHKTGSIGLPFADTLYKIVSVETGEELPRGQEGEIIISGPTVMQGYLNNPDETTAVLRRREDGRKWLHTGDLGFIDEDGYVYFGQRIKRMIITSGYNVYPSQVEKTIEMHPAVDYCCVIGVKDDYKMEKIKAFIVTKDGTTENENLKEEIQNHCRQQIAAYAVPREIEFRKELPKTLVGKVAYRKLEEEQ